MQKSSTQTEWRRTHHLAELTSNQLDANVCLMGWVQSRRDHGGLIFIDLRDREGITQIVLDPSCDEASHALGETVRSEFVLALRGKVRRRPAGMTNPQMPTGEIEVLVSDLEVLNQSKTPPFPIQDRVDVSESIRLEYRYLDLRRPKVKQNIMTRIQIVREMRRALEDRGFLDIETPLLYKSTPEGAREFLVPSRVHAGQFYALPQSPQLFKQVLMVSGFDKYYQIVKCFRDEDLRADRQPEFTQIDCELSFVGQAQVMETIQGVVADAISRFRGETFSPDFPVMAYDQAMEVYGCDKPDTRFGLPLKDIGPLVASCEFKVFRAALDTGGIVNCLKVEGGAKFTRKELDEMTDHIRPYGAKGLAWAKILAGEGLSSWQSPIAKFLGDEVISKVNEALGVKEGDILLFGAGDYKTTKASMAELRLYLGRKLDLVDKEALNFLWVVDFPLFEQDERGRLVACHHPFTSPKPEDVDKLESDPTAIRAAAYDLVLNGNEVAGGSVRIHDPLVQKRLFKTIGLTDDEAREKFGFLLDALQYGAPPHAGIAFGLDRLVMILAGEDSIRDVIPFPKTNKAACLMTASPGPVTKEELFDLHIRVQKPEQTGGEA